MNSALLHNLAEVLDKVATAKLLADEQGTIIFANLQAAEIFRQPRESLVNQPVTTLIAPELRGMFENEFAGLQTRPSDSPLTLNNDLLGFRNNQTRFPLELLINRVSSDDLSYYLFTALDNSEKLQTHRRYKLCFEQSAEGMLLTDDKGTMLMANPRFCNMFGYEEEELIGNRVEMLLPVQLRKAHSASRTEYLSQPTTRRMGSGRELSGLRKDGTELPLEISLAPLPSGDSTEVLVTLVDLTQRREIEEARQQLETKIRQTQKLESLGILTGGIAHDFNNILTGIVGNAELAQMDLPAGSTIRRYLEGILKASHRAADLCEQMLAYSGGGKRLYEALNLNDLIESTSELIQTTLNKSASLVINLDRSLPRVQGDPTQLRQVIMNLIINAAEALKESQGVITISTGVMEFQPSGNAGFNPLEADVAAGCYVYLLVNDNGIGMSRETQEKIFDPFYTTKFTGRGLGLAAVLGIIHSHNGAIRIYSEEGVGTSFRILLPFEGNELLIDEAQPVPCKSGMILIIDDEQVVHDTVSDSLKRLGYTILSARDGLEGLELFKAHHDSLSLVILDLTMPRMGGEETYKHIRELNQEVPVIITSGFSEQDILQKFVGRGIAGFLQKPISPARLMEQVQTTISNSRDETTGGESGKDV